MEIFRIVAIFERILERERERELLSKKIHAIRPSAAFGTRGRTALRGEGFAWVPDLESFFKLLEVGVSPYLSFIPILSVLSMFESNEAVRGRLIGPKPWDRIDINFETKIGAAVYGYGLFGCSLC